MFRPVLRVLAMPAIAISCMLYAGATADSQGPIPVAIELVLAVDVSLSVDDKEFALQMQGLARAFQRREIIHLIGQHDGGVAVVLVQWSGVAQSVAEWSDEGAGGRVQPWRLLTNGPSVLAFADEIASAPRATLGYFTSIGAAIDFSTRLLETNDFEGRRRKIDVSGDGRNNAAPELAEARARALLHGIVINGLAILNNEPGLDRYYQDNVIGGPASFVITAADYDDFVDAMAKKLYRELTVLTSSGPATDCPPPSELAVFTVNSP